MLAFSLRKPQKAICLDFDDAPESVTTNNAQSPQNGVQSVSRVNAEDECAENFEDDIEDEIDD